MRSSRTTMAAAPSIGATRACTYDSTPIASTRTRARLIRLGRSDGHSRADVRLDFEHMAIDRSVVEKAAGLARIALTPDEVERFTGQLSVVLTAVERLKDVDTEKVSPTASVLPVSNVMREDEIRPGLSREEALANAPKGGRDGEFFRVQQVLEERP